MQDPIENTPQQGHDEPQRGLPPPVSRAAWQFSLRGLLLLVLLVSLVLSNLVTVWQLRELRKQIPPPPGFHARTVDAHGNTSVVEYSGSRVGVPQRERFISDWQGLHPLDLGNLGRYLRKKHGYYRSGSQDAAIPEFINLHNTWDTIVLARAQDIPGFTPAQLDPDLRGLPLTPLDIKTANGKIRIVYTWTQVGGALKRYRFHFYQYTGGWGMYCESCATLQSDVGDASGLD